MLTVNLSRDGQTKSLLIHVTKVHNQEEGRSTNEKRIQVGSVSTTALHNYPIIRLPQALVFGLYKREIYDDTIICAWPISGIPSAGTTDSLRIQIDVIARAMISGFSSWRNSHGEIICAFRPEHLHKYIENRETFHSGLIDIGELLGRENRMEILLEETLISGIVDLDDIINMPNFPQMTKEEFERQQRTIKESGCNGEERLNEYFLNLQARGIISEYEWTANLHPYYPYDFTFMRNGEKRFVDAKSTPGGFNRKIFVSINELKMMYHSDHYDLYRIYEESEEGFKFRIVEDVKSFATGIYTILKELQETAVRLKTTFLS